MSGQERKAKIPAAPTPAGPSGNLLSSVAPPSQLPNFITTPVEVPQVVQQPVLLTSQVVPQMPSVTPQTPQVVPHSPQIMHPNISMVPQPVKPVIVKPKENDDAEKFSPAIPLAKGEPMVSIRSPEDSQTTQSPESMPESMSETDKLGDIMPGSGLITWMKGAVSTGGLLQRVAEKAKSSVDSMITTLDPQMKEYLNNSGDLLIVVASNKEVKVSAIREAFQNVFGKANVIGYDAQSAAPAARPVGYAAALAAARRRVARVRAARPHLSNDVPVVAVESFLDEAMSDTWYELGLLVFCQPSLGIELQIQSQGTPVPRPAEAAARAGLGATVGSIMADSLQEPHTQRQEARTGVSRRELLVLAGRALAGSYKTLLAVSAAET